MLSGFVGLVQPIQPQIVDIFPDSGSRGLIQRTFPLKPKLYDVQTSNLTKAEGIFSHSMQCAKQFADNTQERT